MNIKNLYEISADFYDEKQNKQSKYYQQNKSQLVKKSRARSVYSKVMNLSWMGALKENQLQPLGFIGYLSCYQVVRYTQANSRRSSSRS